MAACGARAAARADAAHRCAHDLSSDDPDAQARIGAFLQGLQELGWTVGRNVRIDYRWGGGDAERTRKHAAELVALAPDVILATWRHRRGAVAASDPQRADRVCAGPRSGRRADMSRAWRGRAAMPPASQCSSMDMGGKWLELLKQIAPGVTRAAVLRDSAASAGIGQWGAIQAVAPSLRVEISPVNVAMPARSSVTSRTSHAVLMAA